MRQLVDAKSPPGESRLPTFDAEWTRIINGNVRIVRHIEFYSFDFLLRNLRNVGLFGSKPLQVKQMR